jgi:hypothetical protein
LLLLPYNRKIDKYFYLLSIAEKQQVTVMEWGSRSVNVAAILNLQLIAQAIYVYLALVM